MEQNLDKILNSLSGKFDFGVSEKLFNKNFLNSSFGQEKKFLQQTIAKKVSFTGIGLHGGNNVSMSILPSPINTGIVFRRMDLSPTIEIPALAQLLQETPLCSTLVLDGIKVATVEHVLSALAGLQIDNVVIELSAPEVPILDGSSNSFIFVLQEAGIVKQKAFKKFIRIKQPVYVQADSRWARLEPYDGFRLNFSIDFEHPLIQGKLKNASLDFSTQNYIDQISRARTFGFMQEFEYLRSNNLALGASLDNAIAMSEFNVLNENGLRYADEFVRHKILDAIGDLSLIGSPIIGYYSAYKSGHAMNNRLIRSVLQDPSNFEWVSFNETGSLVSNFVKPKNVFQDLRHFQKTLLEIILIRYEKFKAKN